MKGKLLVGRAELSLVIGALSRDGETKPVRKEMVEMLEKSIVHPEDATSASEDLTNLLIEHMHQEHSEEEEVALHEFYKEFQTLVEKHSKTFKAMVTRNEK